MKGINDVSASRHRPDFAHRSFYQRPHRRQLLGDAAIPPGNSVGDDSGYRHMAFDVVGAAPRRQSKGRRGDPDDAYGIAAPHHPSVGGGQHRCHQHRCDCQSPEERAVVTHAAAGLAHQHARHRQGGGERLGEVAVERRAGIRVKARALCGPNDAMVCGRRRQPRRDVPPDSC